MTTQDVNVGYDSAKNLIEEHNKVIGALGKVDANSFIYAIKQIGGTSLSRLKSLSYEDILECFPEAQRKPVALAKEIAKLWRSEETETKNSTTTVSSKKAEKMTLSELVNNFNPEEFDNSVGQRLSRLSGGNKFIVYSSGRIIDKEVTTSLLEEVRKGFPEREFFLKDETSFRVYKIGELPNNYVAENPCYRGRPLRPLDESCDQTGRSWSGISLETRQFVRLIIEESTISVNLDFVNDLLDILLEPNGEAKLIRRYPKAASKFTELKTQGKLPSLSVPLLANKNNDFEKLNVNPITFKGRK